MDIDQTCKSGMFVEDFGKRDVELGEECIVLRAEYIMEHQTQKQIDILRKEMREDRGPQSAKPPAWHAQMAQFVIVALLAMLVPTAAASSACANTTAVDELALLPYNGDPVTYYYTLCINSDPCASAFFLLTRDGMASPSGRRGFEALFPQAFETPGLKCSVDGIDEPFTSAVAPVICSDGDTDAEVAVRLTDQTWLSCMTIGMGARALCDVSKVWVYDPETGTGACLCPDTADCSVPTSFDRVIFVNSVLFVVIAASALFYRVWQAARTSERTAPDKKM